MHDTFRGKWPKIFPSFSTATAFLSRKYLVLPRTQLFHQLPLPKCPCIHGVNVGREPSGTVWLLWPFCMCEIFCKQNLRWVQSFLVGNHLQKSLENLTHEIFLSWKFSRLRYVLIAYTIKALKCWCLGGSTVALNEFAQHMHSAATCKLALLTI